MVLGLMVPPANGSPWRGSENQPVGLRPVTSARMLVASSMRAFSSARASVLTSSCLSPCAATSWPPSMSPLMRAGSILASDGGHREGRLEPMLGERRQHQVEPLAGGEQGGRAADVLRRYAFRARRPCSGRRRCGRRTACPRASGYPCRRGSSRPRSCSRLSRALAAFPVVVTPPSASPDVARGSAAPPPRRSQTKRLAASSCARSGGRAWRCAGPAPTRRDAGRC